MDNETSASGVAAGEGCGGFADCLYISGRQGHFILDGMGGTGRFYWVESAEERVKSWGGGRGRMKEGVVRAGIL